jgi:hypothetical protein
VNLGQINKRRKLTMKDNENSAKKFAINGNLIRRIAAITIALLTVLHDDWPRDRYDDYGYYD